MILRAQTCAHYDWAPMRALRIVVVGLTILVGAYLLLLANGVVMAMQERTQGWQITPLFVHPVAHIMVYVSSANALQLVSAWLLMPSTVQKGAWQFWGRYAATVGLCIGAGVVAAGVLLFIVQALLDAGKI